MFNKQAFEQAFAASIILLQDSEKVTKAQLLTLSRSVLEAHHATEDIGYTNRLINVLTPVNKKVSILYFQAFSGFLFSNEKQEFTKKNKKAYEACKADSDKFLEDPLNNIWSWAAREVDIEPKEFTIERLKKNLEATLKKATDNQFTQMDVLRTFMEAGLKMDTLLQLMGEIEGKA